MMRRQARARYGTGDFLQLNKRNCPIQLELTPYGCDDLYVRWVLNDREFHFYPRSIWCGEFNGFVNAVYNLYHEKGDQHKYPCNSNRRYRGPRVAGLKPQEVELTVGIWWDRIEYNSITFQRVDSCETEDFFALSPDPIRIVIRRRDTRKAEVFTVDGKDLAYAIGKAATEAIKKYGFYGYFRSTGSNEECGDYFLMHEILFFKAYALDTMEVRELTTVWEDEDHWHHAEATPFESELELLLFDM